MEIAASMDIFILDNGNSNINGYNLFWTMEIAVSMDIIYFALFLFSQI